VSRGLFALMFASSLALWFAVPVGWLWVAGRVQGLTHSLGAAVAVALAGMIVSVIAAVPALHWLARKHQAARAARGLDDLGAAPLEGVMVVSAVIALVGFGVWFLFFAGAEPVPLGLPK
jgi:hypothetical protein